MNMKNLHRARYFLSFILLLFFIVFFSWIIPQIIVDTYAKNKIFTQPNQLPQSQVIMVMGARVFPDKPSQMLAERLDAAITLYQAGKAPKILVSGAATDEHSHEPKIMKQYLIEKGIPSDAILEDDQGTNSYQSFFRAKNHWKFSSLIVATTDYHLPRCVFLGNKLDLPTTGFASPNRFSFNMPYNYLRESLAKLKAVINIYIYAPKKI